jgi:hypothetical protein
MTVTLEPELEQEVRQKAAAQGQETDEYVNRLIKTALRQSAPTIIRSTLTPEEIQRLRLESIERAIARNLPASTSDFRREDIYDDEEGR